MTLKPKTAEEMASMREKAAAIRRADEQRQLDSCTEYKGWTLQEAIGRTGGVPNVGWEAHREGRASRYGSSREELVSSVDSRE